MPNGTVDGIWTHKKQGLSLLRLPIAPQQYVGEGGRNRTYGVSYVPDFGAES